MPAPTSPFPKDNEVFEKLTDRTIPSNAAGTLLEDLSCAVLEALYPHLDLISRKSSSHIDPLHVHLRRGRNIQITEDTRLHLVWHADKVHIKPLPNHLLSFKFWEENLTPGSDGRPHAIGFVRTYAHLIRHRSDFHIAQKEDLIPDSDSDKLQYGDFQDFLQHFRAIGDGQVSPRWEFGQFRLVWLNWAVRVFQPSTTAAQGGMLHALFYEQTYTQTGQFVREFGAPLLFIFATLSLILSAMQVVLAARADNPWSGFASVSAGFSVAVIFLLVAVFVALFAVSVVVLTLQFGFALRERRRRRQAG